MRHIVICGLSGSTAFYTLRYEWQNFLKKKILNIKGVWIFSTTSI
jgi:hypothetical protein